MDFAHERGRDSRTHTHAHTRTQACNYMFPSGHPYHGRVMDGQRTLALIAEMIHTSSLVHDDVIDEASTRRSKASANAMFGDTQAILAGDFILAKVCT